MKLIREKLVVRSMTLLLSLGGVGGVIGAPASAAGAPTHHGRKAPIAKDKERDKDKPRPKTTKAPSAVAAPAPAKAPAPDPLKASVPVPAAPTRATFTASSAGTPAATPAAFKTASRCSGL